jgi:hypothetical protein
VDNPKPYICTRAEKAAAKWAIEKLTAREPCSIIGQSGNVSKNLLTQYISNHLQNTKKVKIVVFAPADIIELETHFPQFENITQPVILILCLGVPTDCSQVLEKLELLRVRYQTSFTSLVIAHVGAVYSALEKRQKILVRSLHVMKPLDFADTLSFLKSFEDRLQFALNPDQRKAIYRFSGGNMGLIKSMYLMLQNFPENKLSISNLFTDEGILYRLQTLTADLPLVKLSTLVSNNQTPMDKLFLTKFGYLKNGRIFNPLLKEYVIASEMLPATRFQYSLTSKELLVFQELKKNLDNFISRDALAFILWGEKREELYSDWAIDQFVHRIKTKLTADKSSYRLETKKGLGIRLVRI